MWQVKNLRYSGLQVCATDTASTLNSYPACRACTANLQVIHVNQFLFRINNPKFFHARSGRHTAFWFLVELSRFWRKNFHEEIGSAFCPRIREDRPVFLRNKDKVRLVHVDLIEINIEG